METEKKMEPGAPIYSAKNDNPRASNVLHARVEKTTGFYVNAAGKGVITDPNLLKGLDPFYSRVSEILLEAGILIIKQPDLKAGVV